MLRCFKGADPGSLLDTLASSLVHQKKSTETLFMFTQQLKLVKLKVVVGFSTCLAS